MTNSIGNRIRTTREQRGISASQFAKLVGVSPTAVSNWENNNMEPRPASLANIARALGVTTEFLLTGADEGDVVFDDAIAILERAKSELANALRIPAERIKLEFGLAI